MMLWKTAGRCAVCAAALLLASFPLLAQKEHAAAPAAKSRAAAGKSDASGKPSAAPAPSTTAEPPAPQPQSAHRRLYTIHRAIGKTSGKGPKKT